MTFKANNYSSLDQYGRPKANTDAFGLVSDGPGMFSSAAQSEGFNTNGASLYSPNTSIAGYMPSPALTQDFSGVGGRSFMDSFTGGKNADGTAYNGWGGMALGAASGLMTGFMGMKNYGLAKQSLAQGKEQFDKNYAAQKMLTNGRASDLYAARDSYSAGSAGTKEDFMKTRSIT